MLPGMVGMGLMQVTTLVNANFVSGLAQQSTTYLNLADRLLELPLSLIAVSLGTALLPTLSKYWVHGQKLEMVNAANFYLRISLLVALPASVGLYFLAEPITALLFQRGKFGPEQVLATAAVVQIYSLTLIASSCVRMVVPNFYAIKNTWLPAAVSALCLLVHLILAPILIERMDLRGLVISTLVSASLNFVFLAFAFRYFFGALGWPKIFVFLGKMILPLAAVVGICLSYDFFFYFFGGHSTGRLVSLVLVVLFSVVVYFAIGFLLKSKECEFVLGGLRRKIRKKNSK
jgi:putative peptidoglycan lipid II flippase